MTDKAWVPDGADRRDFVHVADHAWPDPDRPGGLPWVLRDGHRNPTAGALPADGAALRQVGEAVWALTLAAGVGVHEGTEATDRALELVHTFFCAPATGMRPALRVGVVVPGREGPTCWGLARMQPISDVIDGLGLLEVVAPMASEVPARFRSWGAAFFDWLMDSDLLAAELARANNHATWAVDLVLALAASTGAADVLDEVLARVPDLLDAQVGPDGSQPAEASRPRSFYYRGFNMTAMLRVAERAAPLGLDLFGEDAAPRRAANALLAALTHPAQRGPAGPEPSDRGRHGDLLVRMVAAWPSVDVYRAALVASDLRPPPRHPVWLECGLDPEVEDT